jgi:predicted  nucleic acid-binding Zn-ribbon protein
MMNEIEETIPEEVLIEILNERQPYWREKLQVLSDHFAGKPGHGVFAPIKGCCCGACRVKVATARLQRTSGGVFIACANCARLLYAPDSILARNQD